MVVSLNPYQSSAPLKPPNESREQGEYIHINDTNDDHSLSVAMAQAQPNYVESLVNKTVRTL